MEKYVDVVFDGPPGPEAGRFVEVENHEGKSITFGKWVEREDGFWALRLESKPLRFRTEPVPTAFRSKVLLINNNGYYACGRYDRVDSVVTNMGMATGNVNPRTRWLPLSDILALVVEP